jgi:hypothetical protein
VGHHEREQCYACSGSGPDRGRIEAIELRAPLAAMTSARDGDFAKAPETGEGLAAELGAMFDQIMDRGGHCNAELTRVRREIVRHGRLDERVDLHDGNRQLRGNLRRLGRAVHEMVDQPPCSWAR